MNNFNKCSCGGIMCYPKDKHWICKVCKKEMCRIISIYCNVEKKHMCIVCYVKSFWHSLDKVSDKMNKEEKEKIMYNLDKQGIRG